MVDLDALNSEEVEAPLSGKEWQPRISPTDISQFLRLEQCQR